MRGRTGQIITNWLGRNVLCKLLLRIVFHRLFSVTTPLGRKLRSKIISQGGPLIRTKLPQLTAAGVQRTGRITGARAGKPCTETGESLDVKNVVCCTGFDGGLSFIDLPVFAADGEPLQQSGVAANTPGLYFVGLHFQHAMSSGMIHGVGRDAARIARAVQRYQRTLV